MAGDYAHVVAETAAGTVPITASKLHEFIVLLRGELRRVLADNRQSVRELSYKNTLVSYPLLIPFPESHPNTPSPPCPSISPPFATFHGNPFSPPRSGMLTLAT